jgi:hypothetical protein
MFAPPAKLVKGCVPYARRLMNIAPILRNPRVTLAGGYDNVPPSHV